MWQFAYELLRPKREERGETLKEFRQALEDATGVGITTEWARQLEEGKEPSLRVFYAICDFYRKDPTFFSTQNNSHSDCKKPNQRGRK